MRKTVLLIIALAFCVALKAQENASWQLSMNHLALSVKDLDRAAGFYSSVLQLKEVENRAKSPGIRWFSLGDGKELHLIANIKEPVTVNKAVHLALTTAHFDDFIKHLEESNIMYSDWPGTPKKVNVRADGIKQIYFQDLDGYWIEVNSVAEK